MQIKEIVGKINYTNKAGEEKKLWIKAGKLYIKDDGTFSVKINSWINPMAFSNEKQECWFGCYDIKQSEKPAPAQVQAEVPAEDSTDVPF